MHARFIPCCMSSFAHGSRKQRQTIDLSIIGNCNLPACTSIAAVVLCAFRHRRWPGVSRPRKQHRPACVSACSSGPHERPAGIVLHAAWFDMVLVQQAA